MRGLPRHPARIARSQPVVAAIALTIAALSKLAAADVPAPKPESALSESEVRALQGPKALSPREAIKKFTVADGLEVRLVASEPLVRQPVSISFDDRGRLWVLQYLQYPVPEGLTPVAVDEYLRTKYDRRPDPPPKGPKGRDRLTILEDTDGDGVMDHAKDFIGGLNLASGFAIGYGGVFIVQSPYLLFYPDANGDDVPDGAPEVLLTGFGMEDAHAFANSLTWGPDGWLYGAQGSTVSANIRGIEFQQGIWRYHPKTKKFELFAEGGGNTWGIDFDRFGNLFAGGNTLEPLCHHVQGAYYVKGFGKHGPLHNPYSFGYFQPVEHKGPFGGGLTGGNVVYQGAAFPERFDNVCIAPNIRQNAVRWYPFETKGSTFATRQGGDFLVSSDPWFRPVDMTVGPDGALYVADWYDIHLSHASPVNRSQWYMPSREDGRIWRVAAKEAKPSNQSLASAKSPVGKLPDKLSASDLVALLDHPNSFQRRELWPLLGAHPDRKLIPAFKERFASSTDEVKALEALWAVYLCGGFDDAFVEQAFSHPGQSIRAWTIRLLADKCDVSDVLLQEFVRLAKSDPSCVVRSQLACSAKRLPGRQGLPIVAELIQHDEDVRDPHVPLLIWWAIESKAVSDRDAVLALLKSPETWRSPIVRDVLIERLARRYLAAGENGGYAACAWLLDHAPAPSDTERVVAGMETQLAGRRFDRVPPELAASLRMFTQNGTPSVATLCLALRLGNAEVWPNLASLAKNRGAPQADRVKAIRALAEAGPPTAAHELLPLVDAREPDAIAEAVLTALGQFKEESLGTRLLEHWSELSAKRRDRVIDALVSRRSWTHQLLAAVAAGRVDPKIVSIDQVRRMQLHGDPGIARDVTGRWGSIRTSTPREKQGRINAISILLTKGSGHPQDGHALFAKHCAICHRLYGEGNQVGPDLTAADRKDLRVLLPNVVDPSAVIRPEFRAYNVVLHDGRILAGLLADSNSETITVLDAKNQRTVIKRTDVEELRPSEISLMPENVLAPLNNQEIRDLFAYLRSK
ncbi:MAG TPA: PVC-type heme-binding CxxCH protein [Planctomycetaceae bacterium]|nr:PVC-type heme-binding CxxCH protein [Planctomycetaceae bacterium]